MVRERRWWSIPRVPPPTWWRRRDSSASRTERRSRSVVVDISEPLESKLVPSRAAPAVPSPPIECSQEDMPSISFSFFEENAKTDETELEVKSERQCDGCEETEDILEEKVEKDVESEEVKVDEVEDPLVTKEEDQHDIDEETKEVNLEEISQETKEEEDLKEVNREAEEEKAPEEIKEEKEMQEVKREIRERPTSLAEDSPPCGSDGGYEVLRVRSEPDMLPRESARVGVSEPRYASPRASFAPWDGSEVCSLSDTYLYQTTSEARSEATKAEDYEELEYCAVRAGQRRATLLRGPGRGTSARVGRAWRALRVWWRSERSRLAQAVQRHARAAHALAATATSEAPAEEPSREQPKEEEVEAAESTAVAVVVHRRLREEPRSRPLSRAGLVRSRYIPEGQNGFEELRRYIKQGGDFCKDLSSILQERSEAETQYAKTLSKLSGKLLKASKDSVGSVNQAWQRAGSQMEAQSEAHRAFAAALSEEVVKPLRQLVESQHRIRKSVESVVDKTAKSLSEWRAAEAKSKKQSFLSARENEKLQDVSLDVRLGRNTGSAHALHHNHKQVSDKECAKLESKRRKAEEHVKKADVEYYTFCIRAERARLEWETAVIRGSHCFQALEEERLQQLKDVASCYLHHLQDMGPKLIQSTEKMTEPVQSCDVARDIQTVVSIKGTGQPIPEQLLPDFYAEHITLAMNRERRRQALVKILQLIRQDLERERRGKQGVESLARALQQTPNFGAEDSQQNLSEKLHHMRSMLTYLEAARYKVQSALAELDGRTRGSHPLAPHIQVTRDKQGLQQSVLKVPPWVRKESLDQLAGEAPDWTDRGAGDGNSVQPDSDFDEFSSQGSEKDYQSSVMTYPVISECSETPQVGGARCRALYEYAANLYDELNIRPGDVINIHDKQADGWWLGELNGVIGIFPATYVEEIK